MRPASKKAGFFLPLTPKGEKAKTRKQVINNTTNLNWLNQKDGFIL